VPTLTRIAAPPIIAFVLATFPATVVYTVARWSAAAVETLKPVAALPAHIANQFEHLSACQQSASGVYFVFDRRAHHGAAQSRSRAEAH
jgi:hypothetical protein